jgi:hypothetical protein
VFAQNAGKPTDPKIAHIAYTAGKIDIEAAQQALSKSQNKEVREFANCELRGCLHGLGAVDDGMNHIVFDKYQSTTGLSGTFAATLCEPVYITSTTARRRDQSQLRGDLIARRSRVWIIRGARLS